MSEETTRQLPDDALRQILARFDSMDARLMALEDKVERRLQETRPIWEQVLIRLTEVDERLTKGLRKVQDEVFLLRRKFDAWASDVSLLRLKQEDLEERFEEFKAEGSK